MRTALFLAVALSLGAAAACSRAPDAAVAHGMCAEHHVPEADCPFCNKGLVEQRGMCVEHGVPEALCWICNPALIEAYKAMDDWCGGHGVPESRCVKCQPSLAAAKAAAAAAEPAAIRVEENPDAPRRRRAPSATCTTESKRVVLATPEMATTAGFRYETIGTRPVVETVSAGAELAFVQSAYAHVAARVAGTVREVRVNVGDHVAAGDVLAVIDAPEIAAARADVVQAQALAVLRTRSVERERSLLDRRLSTQREVISAEAALAEAELALAGAKQRLRNFGVPDADVERCATTGEVAPSMVLVAPFAGTVVERTAVLGDVVDTARTLFDVADTSTVWAVLSVPERDAGRVARGQAAVVRIGGERGDRVAGRVSWVSPRVDQATRTVGVQVVLPNPDGALRAGAFGSAEIEIHRGDALAAVPKAAVQWEGCCNLAFVKSSEQTFLPRKLKLGADLGAFYAVESGLAPGEVVVTEGSFLLRTEIRKDSIGAGCCAGD